MSLKPEPTGEMCIIAAGSVFEGKLRTPGSVRIEGRVVGEVVASQSISVGGSGDVDGNISAKNVTLGGKTKGVVIAQEKLVFESKAVVRGDIRASKLVIEEGALFDGKCMMSEAKPAGPVMDAKADGRPGG